MSDMEYENRQLRHAFPAQMKIVDSINALKNTIEINKNERDAELDALRKENQLMREVVRAARDIFNPNDSNARIKLANAFEEYDVATASQSRTEEEKSDLTKAVEKARGGTMPPPNMQGYA